MTTKSIKKVKKTGNLEIIDMLASEDLQIEEIEENFPILDYQKLDKLIKNIDNIIPIDLQFINNYFMKNILPNIDKEKKFFSTKEPLKCCTSVAISNFKTKNGNMRSLLSLATIWDIIFLFNLNTKNVFYLQQKKPKQYGRIQTFDFSPSGDKLLVGYEKGVLILWDVLR